MHDRTGPATRDQKKYAEWKDKAGRYLLPFEISFRGKLTAGAVPHHNSEGRGEHGTRLIMFSI